MTRRVRPGDQLNITATEYNRLLAAADALHKNRLPGGGGPRTHMQNAATVRVHNITSETIPIGGVGGFQTPLTDPLKGPVELARFVRDATIKVGKPGADGSTGRIGVAIEPIAEDKVGRVVFDGVVAALVNVKKAWHEYADASLSPNFILESKPEGSAQILWRRNPTETGVQWAVVRVGHPKDIVYLVKVPPGGITARKGVVTGSGECDLFKLDETGNIEPVLDVDGEQVRIVARNHSTQRIRGPIDGSGDQYLTVTFDGNQM